MLPLFLCLRCVRKGVLPARREGKFGVAESGVISQKQPSISMRPTTAAALRTLCVTLLALGLVASAPAAEARALIGLTRDQVIEQLGEVKSLINAGSREVLFFERDRVTLRDGVVIEVDGIAPPRPTPPPPVTPAPTPEALVDPAAPVAPPSGATPGIQSVPPTAVRPPVASDPLLSQTPPAQPLPAPVPEGPAPLLIRPRPANRPAAAASAPASAPAASASGVPAAEAPVPEAAPAPASAPVAEASEASPSPPPAVVADGVVAEPPVLETAVPDPAVDAAAPAPPESVATAPESPVSAPAEAEDKMTAPAAAVAAEAATKKTIRPRAADAAYVDPTASLFNLKNLVIIGTLIAGGIGYLFWRNRQRAIALAATTVSSTPFSAPPLPAAAGVKFDAAFLAKLEWKRFESLVAAYYSKTGVVATSTQSGPGDPVHVKISWKGEARPFAYVQCLAHPAGLVPATTIQDLFRALSADEIRRGYVVSSGKFSVPARDFAEEKHITLLTGDIFLEKLNALPDLARNEIMAEITTGDYTTPTCPKCAVKMVRLDDTTWRCSNHPRCEVTMPVRKI